MALVPPSPYSSPSLLTVFSWDHSINTSLARTPTWDFASRESDAETNSWRENAFLVAQWCYCLIAQLCLTLCSPMDCSLPGSSVHEISQARTLEGGAISFSRGSSWPRVQTCNSCTGRGILYHWATREKWELPKSVKGWFPSSLLQPRKVLFHGIFTLNFHRISGETSWMLMSEICWIRSLKVGSNTIPGELSLLPTE